MAAAGKILILAVALAPMLANATICFRSAPAANIEGVSGPAVVSLLWNDTENAMDELKIEGDRINVSADLNCTDSPPIVCGLGEGIGSVRLVFERNTVRVVSSGLKVKKPFKGSSREPELGLKPQRQTMVNELTQMSEEECRVAFPVRRTIKVFPDDVDSAKPKADAVR